LQFLVLNGALVVHANGGLLMHPYVVGDLHHYFIVDCHPRPQPVAEFSKSRNNSELSKQKRAELLRLFEAKPRLP
jgi:hypothetical protein